MTNAIKEKSNPQEERTTRRVTWEELSHAVLVVSTQQMFYQSNNQIIFILALQIFATIGIYLTICFIIFLIIAWMSKRNSMKIPSDISFDCPGSKSGMSLEISQRDISDRVCMPYPPSEQQDKDDGNLAAY